MRAHGGYRYVYIMYVEAQDREWKAPRSSPENCTSASTALFIERTLRAWQGQDNWSFLIEQYARTNGTLTCSEIPSGDVFN